MTITHRLAEILQVVGQTLFLLTDIQFLDIVNQFLLQTVLVIIHTRNLLQSVNDTLANLLYTTLLERFDFCQQTFDIINLLSKLLLERSTLLLTEIHQGSNGTLNSLAGSIPLFVGELFLFCLRQHIRHACQGVHPVLGLRDTHLRSYVLQLMVVVLHESGIHRRCIHSGLFLNPEREVHLTTLQ